MSGAAMDAFLDRPFTFDRLRDPDWQPTRDDYKSLRDGARELIEQAEIDTERKVDAELRGRLEHAAIRASSWEETADRLAEALEQIVSPRSGHLQRDQLRAIAREALTAFRAKKDGG